MKRISEPFVDPTPEARIGRLIRDEMARRGVSTNGHVVHHRPSPGGDHAPNVLGLDQHPSLRFTRLLTAVVDGVELHRPKWNGMMNYVHVLGLKRLGSLEELKRVTRARLKPGRYEDEGYKYVPEGDFSIQGLDAEGAWDSALAVGRAARFPIVVTFQWREDGERPGEIASLEWEPKSA